MQTTALSASSAHHEKRDPIMDGVVFVGRDGVISLLNAAAEELLGVKGFWAIGKTVAALGESSFSEGDELVAALAQEGAEGERTVEIDRGNHQLDYIRLRTSVVLDWQGAPAGTMTVLEDVTDNHKSDQRRNQYLSIVAHELRTPLTGIKTFSTMMATGKLGELPEKQQLVMDSIREQSLRLEHQIDKLINLGSIEADGYGRDLQRVALRPFVVSVVSPFEQAAADRSVELVFDEMAIPEVDIAADRNSLRRGAQALVENAIKFAPEGGRVEVRVKTDGEGGLQLVVEDDGMGIDRRYHGRVFEEFFQVEDPLTRHHGGAGLGLFVAQGIVRAHGSEVEVRSELGRGATFWFSLPQPPADDDDSPEPPNPPNTLL